MTAGSPKRPRTAGPAAPPAAGAAGAVASGGPDDLTAAQWAEFREKGYVKLGRVIPDELMGRMRERIDDIMMGTRRYDRLIMQLDPGSAYSGAVQSEQTAGFKGETVGYRKIGEAGAGLECDEVFREAMTLPVFRAVCAEVYGAHVDIAVYRAMMFNKPAGKGTDLPWHQDGGDWWGLDRDPQVFVWTAIDAATKANGCVRVVPGSHKRGLLSRRGHTLSQANLEALQVEALAADVEVAAGESVLMHNFLIHSSGVNPTGEPRRAFSVNYADGRTRVRDPRPEVEPEGVAGPPLGLTEGKGLPIVFRQDLPAC